jgi:polysaccharide export outer membrane protein
MRIRPHVLIAVAALAAVLASAQQLKQRPQYRLQPGDLLELQYHYTPELNQTATITPDGYVNLNLVGNVKVSDLTMQQAHDLIVKKASDHLNDPVLNLILRDFQRPYVVVAGEVPKPGRIDLRETTTAMQAILLAGGFSDTAQSGQVVLFRRINSDEAEVKVLHLTNINKTRKLEHDVTLQQGDMLLVPRNKVAKLSRYMKLLNVGTYFNAIDIPKY